MEERDVGADGFASPYLKSGFALPLTYQRLEKAARLEPLLRQMDVVFKDSSGEDDSSSTSEDSEEGDASMQGISGERTALSMEARREKKKLRKRYYNLTGLTGDRKWLRDFLLDIGSDEDLGEDSEEEITEEEFQEMFRDHVKEKKSREKWTQETQKSKFMFYSATVFRNGDEYRENQMRVRPQIREYAPLLPKAKVVAETEANSTPVTRPTATLKPRKSASGASEKPTPKAPRAPAKPPAPKKLSKKEQKALEQAIAKRKKHWISIAKKEIPKAAKTRLGIRREGLQQCKKMAQMCMRYRRHEATQGRKAANSTVSLAKRLTREMMTFWKKHERVERELRKRAEKEEEEQRKRDFEMLEVKRQQRKLNFLITQTELYAHFLSRKLDTSEKVDTTTPIDGEDAILGGMDEKGAKLEFDDYDPNDAKRQIMSNVENALAKQKERVGNFGAENAEPTACDDRPQPDMFCGELKSYQLIGMNWIANLYDQGISGTLADEMGLGKTIQSIAFLAHIAERYDNWGPFLIVAPASTLHNWEQEISKFAPSFKVVPYWGTPNERKILRQFFVKGSVYAKDSLFHIVITSYQLIVTDFKYFQKMKWQYMILDEAQAIKSSTSQRWKTLLNCNCRNRLLLSGTPIQNTMAELWALLHFIMPTLFDSHQEFNDWFSKDVEGHAENKKTMDAKHLSRLHMILKPFMLRRTKKDVEYELADKIEVLVHCSLTEQQRVLYQALRKTIRVDDLVRGFSSNLNGSVSVRGEAGLAASLINIVMQFRKVCNHPALFEKTPPRSPTIVELDSIAIPKLIYEEAFPSSPDVMFRRAALFRRFSASHASSIFKSVVEDPCSLFAFCLLVPWSIGRVAEVLGPSWLARWNHVVESSEKTELDAMNSIFHPEYRNKSCDMLAVVRPRYNRWSCDRVQPLVFVKPTRPAYSYVPHVLHYVPESLEHAAVRRRMPAPASRAEEVGCDPFPHRPRPPKVYSHVLAEYPRFLFTEVVPKIQSPAVKLHCSSSCQALESVRLSSVSWDRVRRRHPDVLALRFGSPGLAAATLAPKPFFVHESPAPGGVEAVFPIRGSFCSVSVPDVESLISESGKMKALDVLLKRLKAGSHRVLIYSQMTKMIDILEEYMCYRRYRYMRLDGSSKIAERRDMVKGFQGSGEIFVFLLSTRAGGLGINLTAADTVIFYDSDWNPTVDQQAMDRAHRLGQKRQVTVYRMICKGSIEERILQRAQEKSEIHRMVISGGAFRTDTLKPAEVVSLLLDDGEIERKFRQKQEERKLLEEQRGEKKRKTAVGSKEPSPGPSGRAPRFDAEAALVDGFHQSLAATARRHASKSGKRVSKGATSSGEASKLKKKPFGRFSLGRKEGAKPREKKTLAKVGGSRGGKERKSAPVAVESSVADVAADAPSESADAAVVDSAAASPPPPSSSPSSESCPSLQTPLPSSCPSPSPSPSPLPVAASDDPSVEPGVATSEPESCKKTPIPKQKKKKTKMMMKRVSSELVESGATELDEDAAAVVTPPPKKPKMSPKTPFDPPTDPEPVSPVDSSPGPDGSRISRRANRATGFYRQLHNSGKR